MFQNYRVKEYLYQDHEIGCQNDTPRHSFERNFHSHDFHRQVVVVKQHERI
jgi:hypothetical protein